MADSVDCCFDVFMLREDCQVHIFYNGNKEVNMVAMVGACMYNNGFGHDIYLFYCLWGK